MQSKYHVKVRSGSPSTSERAENFILKTTRAFVSANIPLEKLDNDKLHNWLNKNVKGDGDIPSARKIIEEDIKSLKVVTCILCNETTDKGRRCVFNILFKKLEPASNQTTKLVATIILLTKYEIEFDPVIAIVSDSAPYMTKCFSNLAGLLENTVHLQCWAHNMYALLGNTWQSTLTLFNKSVGKIKKAFLNSRK
ncbi:hypothetical protein PR048_005877 [Dryococelus australis]|uniref:DUF659 domain-containing protein n=1 Tax=Dryococelus australis TaxID=614101 RepID=A0ABQ9IAE2_9NEOP|nr:hypothetical protein PR048_005877 [Dryococelus australis]